MQAERIGKRIAAMAAQLADLLGEPVEALSTAERLGLAAQWETLTRSQAAITHRLVAAVAAAPLAELGESSVAEALATLLRIYKPEDLRRIREAADLGQLQALTGEALDPVLAHTAAAPARWQRTMRAWNTTSPRSSLSAAAGSSAPSSPCPASRPASSAAAPGRCSASSAKPSRPGRSGGISVSSPRQTPRK